MNKKSLIILVVIFVILIALVFVKKNMKPQVPTTEEITDIIASTVVLDNLSGIAIRLGDGETQDDEKPRNVGLSKDDTGQWVVGSFYDVYANENTVKSLVEKLDQLQGELRSNKKGVLGDYGIGDDNRKLFFNEPYLHLFHPEFIFRDLMGFHDERGIIQPHDPEGIPHEDIRARDLHPPEIEPGKPRLRAVKCFR